MKKTRARILAYLSGFIISNIALAADGSSTSPAPVTDVYHQVSVTDPYRWLENGADPRVGAGLHGQRWVGYREDCLNWISANAM